MERDQLIHDNWGLQSIPKACFSSGRFVIGFRYFGLVNRSPLAFEILRLAGMNNVGECDLPFIYLKYELLLRQICVAYHKLRWNECISCICLPMNGRSDVPLRAHALGKV